MTNPTITPDLRESAQRALEWMETHGDDGNEPMLFGKVADALRAALAANAAPVAWLHTLNMECGQESTMLTDSQDNPFGVPGRDYSPEYTVTSAPLFLAAAPEAPCALPAQGDAPAGLPMGPSEEAFAEIWKCYVAGCGDTAQDEIKFVMRKTLELEAARLRPAPAEGWRPMEMDAPDSEDEVKLAYEATKGFVVRYEPENILEPIARVALLRQVANALKATLPAAPSQETSK